jgi:hypothetical protein
MSDVAPTEDQLLRQLLGASGPELACDQCFAELDRYVDLELAGAPADRMVVGMRAHLAGCEACREEHLALLAFVQSAR